MAGSLLASSRRASPGSGHVQTSMPIVGQVGIVERFQGLSDESQIAVVGIIITVVIALLGAVR